MRGLKKKSFFFNFLPIFRNLSSSQWKSPQKIMLKDMVKIDFWFFSTFFGKNIQNHRFSLNFQSQTPPATLRMLPELPWIEKKNWKKIDFFDKILVYSQCFVIFDHLGYEFDHGTHLELKSSLRSSFWLSNMSIAPVGCSVRPRQDGTVDGIN